MIKLHQVSKYFASVKLGELLLYKFQLYKLFVSEWVQINWVMPYAVCIRSLVNKYIVYSYSSTMQTAQGKRESDFTYAKCTLVSIILTHDVVRCIRKHLTVLAQTRSWKMYEQTGYHGL